MLSSEWLLNDSCVFFTILPLYWHYKVNWCHFGIIWRIILMTPQRSSFLEGDGYLAMTRLNFSRQAAKPFGFMVISCGDPDRMADVSLNDHRMCEQMALCEWPALPSTISSNHDFIVEVSGQLQRFTGRAPFILSIKCLSVSFYWLSKSLLSLFQRFLFNLIKITEW